MKDIPLLSTAFNVCSEAAGKDPDSHSPTLRRYHRLLWAKPLPSGKPFEFDATLHHASDLGDFWLSSDAIVNTYSHWKGPAFLLRAINGVPSVDRTAFFDLACTVGAYLVFPLAVQVDGAWPRSINQRRGTDIRIRDRFDLTLECIRRHYEGAASPLGDVLARHADFFSLFDDFRGYVRHFLLDDLVSDGTESVRFWKAPDDFAAHPLPTSASEYSDYMDWSMHFIRSRNQRISEYAAAMPAPE